MKSSCKTSLCWSDHCHLSWRICAVPTPWFNLTHLFSLDSTRLFQLDLALLSQFDLWLVRFSFVAQFYSCFNSQHLIPIHVQPQGVLHSLEHPETNEKVWFWNIPKFWKLKLLLLRTLYFSKRKKRGKKERKLSPWSIINHSLRFRSGSSTQSVVKPNQNSS